MSFTLHRTDTFLRTARRFFNRHPDLKPEFLTLLERLEKDPFDTRLHLHPLHGKHRDKHSVSLSYSFRVVLKLVIKKRNIFLLDIGSHDEVYR